MSTAAAFLELKRFLTGVESTSQKLKANVTEEKSSASFHGLEGDAFVDSLESNVLSVQTRLDDIETNICGAIDTRLSQVTMLEILQKCKALHHANQEMITAVESHMTNYGYIAPILPIESLLEENECFAPIVAVSVTINQEFTKLEESIQPDHDFGSDVMKMGLASSKQNDDFLDVTLMNDDNSKSDDNMYNSPQNIKTPMALGSEHEVKTPALPDWKLSEATRMLVQNKDGKDGRDFIKERVKLSSLTDPTTPYNNLKLSQLNGEDSISKGSIPQLQTVFNNNDPIRNVSHGVSSREQEIEIITPKALSQLSYNNNNNNKLQESYQDDGDSPKTPCLGTPFHTTRLRTMGGIPAAGDITPGSPVDVKVNLARALNLSLASPMYSPLLPSRLINDDNNRTIDSPVTPFLQRDDDLREGIERTKILPLSSDSRDDLDNTQQPSRIHKQLFSPPKIAILAPRPAAAGDIRPTSTSTSSSSVCVIPMVTEVEWVTAPGFLRKQVRTSSLFL